MAKASRHTVASVLAGRIDVAQNNAQILGREIAAFLLDARLTGQLDSILRDIIQIRAEHGIVEVTAVSAHPLTDSVRADIEHKIRTHILSTVGAPAASKIILSERHDPMVAGGVRLELANHQLDLSVRAKLNRFKQLTTTNTTGGAK